MIEYVTHNWVDEVLVSVKSLEPLPEEIIDALTAMGVTVHISLNKSTQRAGVKQTISNIGGLLVITASINYMSRRQALAKRVLDICGGLAGCFITGVLYLFLAPMIKRESPGPVFFSQTRIGQNGKPFAFYKFRSMYTDAEERKTALLAQNGSKMA
jgi:lipopolysaccharide/colanic/teichoic acid biosynthesis glycosyltransferase